MTNQSKIAEFEDDPLDLENLSMDPEYLTPTRLDQRITYLVGHLNNYILRARKHGNEVLVGARFLGAPGGDFWNDRLVSVYIRPVLRLEDRNLSRPTD